MQTNQIYNIDCVRGMEQLPPHSIDLIIADPPYFKVKGEFDNAWGTDFDAYLADCDKWAEAMARVLKDNGTLIWYGDYRRIAYIQVLLDKRFELLNNCTIEKVNSIQNTFSSTDTARSYFVNEERLLIYCSANAPAEVMEKGRYAEGMILADAMRPVYGYLIGELKKTGKTQADVNRALKTSMASHWFTDKSQFAFPSEGGYEKLREWLRNEGHPTAFSMPYDELVRRFDECKAAYERNRRPFRMDERQNDIFRVVTKGATDTRLYSHATPKPTRLTKDLIMATTKEGATVLVPFVGSGTECVCAQQLGRNFIGFELNKEYAEKAQKRVKNEAQLELFR